MGAKSEEIINGTNTTGTYTLKNGVSDTKINMMPDGDDSKKKGKKKKDKEKEGDEEDENKLPPVPMSQLFRYANGKEKCLTLLGFLAAMTAGLCMPALFILFGDVTNSFVYQEMITSLDDDSLGYAWEMFPQLENLSLEETRSNLTVLLDVDDFFHDIAVFGIGTFVIAAIQLVCGYIFVTTMNYAAEGQVYRLRGKFLKSILRQEIGWFDTHQTNDFASRVTEDLNKMQEGIGEKVGMFAFFMTIFVASIINAFIHGWELTLIILSAFPVLGITTGVIAKIQSNLSSLELKEYARAGSIAEEVLSSVRTVLSFGGEQKEVERYQANLVHAQRAGVKRGLMTGVGMGMMWLIIYAAYALAFWYGTGLILDSRKGDGDYDPGKLLIVFFSVLMGAMNVGQASPYMEAFSVARGAAAAIFDIVERKSAIDPTSTEGHKPNTITGNIELRNVHFNYPSRPDVPILRGINLKVEPGQTVALVGSSGCGKSTCIQLVQRFYDPGQGSVLMDGKDVKSLNLGWVRDQIGVVGQEPVLFATTIAENIRYGREGVSRADIEAAAQEANAHYFIMKLPKQYETQVGERGAQISGGQKQRIAIARALVRQPRILLLDEATSALDNQSEAVVQQALDKVRLGRTTMVVAHRLTTIRTADKIVVFDEGQIVEEGSHQDLMSLKGHYYKLVTAQLTPEQLKKAHDDMCSGDDSTDSDAVSDISQSLVDELVNMPSVALSRAPSVRRSIRRRSSTRSSKRRARRTKKKTTHKKDDDDEDDDYKPVPVGEILKMNSSEWPYIVGGIIGSAVQGVTIPLYAVMFGDVLGSLATTDEETARKEANLYSILFLVIGIIAAFSMFLQAYMFALSGELLTSRLRKLTFAAMLKQEMGWFDETKNSVGALCSRLSGDAAAVQGATGSRVGTVVQAITTLGTSTIMVLVFDWRLGLVSLPFIPFVLAAVYLQAKILMGQSVTESKILQDAGKIAIESITNIRTVASLHKEQHFAKMYSDALYGPHKEALKKSHLRGFTFGFAQSVPFMAYATTILYGGHLVDTGIITYDIVFKVAEALILGTMMVGQAVAFAPNYSKAKVAAGHIFNLLQRRPAIDSSPGVGLRLSGPISKVEMTEGHFAYPTRPDTAILKGLGLQVGLGKTLALVGASGCGKSTIISLLERFYDLNNGALNINDQNIQAVNIGWTRGELGLVSQEPVLFDITIADNIAYGDNTRTVTQHEIVEAAKQANIHTFIESLPEKYKTRVGSKGTQLSGGQKQRIAIARALIRNPSVLLLDEATSALDTESEKVVQEALEKAQAGRTSIVIAHRLSTIQGADSIAVVDGGTVVETGTHTQLMDMKGHYYSLYQTNR
ncbi:hypothetical protein Pcinc_008524 [Petrolisthes cinctipes]|uniref:ABC-type xenobiotic transporter n=1 Tax=Petrolisthes cinctipes TaxID=88211 RepID=A0AAE1KX81_PETCI|nr:hypothetical protein Pcinc_008524 [Petrolisthes cinctipes]